MKKLLLLLPLFLLLMSCGSNTSNTGSSEWKSLFNGKNLDGWLVKIRGYDLGQNYGNTFRVENGVLQVRYDQYKDFKEQFGHIHYKTPFSNYHLRLEYRFVGEWLHDTPGWAYRNSGIMFHGQDPGTIGKDQDFPISIEYQLLGGLEPGVARPTGNMCSPGTDIVYEGKVDSRHCISSSSKTYYGDEWVKAELIVYGDSLIRHIINGDTVMTYTHPRVFGSAVSNFIEEVKKDGTPLKGGFISLQSEGSPVDFRNIEIRELEVK